MIDAQVEDGSIAELQQHLLSAKRQEKYKYLLAGLSSGEETDSTKKKPFRKRVGKFIESRPIQIFVLVLTVLDLIIIGVDLFLEEHFSRCKEVHNEHVELAELILSKISLAILCLLGVEILIVLFAFGAKFFKHPLYVMDMVVIGLSLYVDVGLKDNAGALLIVFRLWRLVRIAHGVAMSMSSSDHRQIALLEKQTKKYRETLRQWKQKYNITEAFPYETDPRFSSSEKLTKK